MQSSDSTTIWSKNSQKKDKSISNSTKQLSTQFSTPESKETPNPISEKGLNEKAVFDLYENQDELIEIEKYQPKSLLKQFQELKEVKVDCPIDSGIVLRDLSLKVKGPQEDQAFALDPQLWLNIRRGNTILDFYDEENKYDFSTIGRKGLNKFFDLQLTYLDKGNRDKFVDLSSLAKQPFNSHNSPILKNQILYGAYTAIKNGFEVEIVKTLKANGENAQISWSEDASAWVIASKNVAIMAEKYQDVVNHKYYSQSRQSRYFFAIQMAKQWFQILKDLQNQPKGRKLLDQLKVELSGRTLVGEYIGNPNFQHLVKYERQTLIFYAIVENEALTPEICWLPERTTSFLRHYKLDRVRSESLGIFDDYDEFCEELKQSYLDTASASIQDEEEGAVLYFVKRRPTGSKTSISSSQSEEPDRVLSLTKLKTLEYRLFRKIREKLRNFFSGNSAPSLPFSKLVGKFRGECKDLCNQDGHNLLNDLPQDFQFYVEIFKIAHDKVKFGDKKLSLSSDYYYDLLMDHYVDFLEEILSLYEAQNEFRKGTYSDYFFSNVLSQTRENDSIQSNESASMKSQTNSTSKSQAKAQVQSQKDESNRILKSEKVVGKSEKVKNAAASQITVVVPIGLPGMGKSKFCGQVLERQVGDAGKLEVVSSDKVRAKLIDSYAKEHPAADKEKCFQATSKKYKVEYSNLLKSTINKSADGAVIFIDKNHPPDAIENLLKQIDEYSEGQFEVKKVALIPVTCLPGQELAKEFNFSAYFIVKCFLRILNRNEHDTLTNEDPCKVTEVLLRFVQLFRNFKFDEKFLLKNQGYKFDQVISFDFVDHVRFGKKIFFSDEIVKLLRESIQTSKPSQKQIEKLTFCIQDHIAFWKNENDQFGESSKNAIFDIFKKPQRAQSSLLKQNLEIKKVPTKNLDPNSKAPLYLSINLSQDQVTNVIYKQILEFFEKLLETKDDSQKDQIENDMKSTIEQLSLEKDKSGESSASHQLVVAPQLHVTCRYVGKNQKKWKEVCEACQFCFQENEKVNLETKAIVYVPAKILAVYALPVPQEGQITPTIENEFPHITIAVNRKQKVQAKHSNDLLLAAREHIETLLDSDKANSKSAEIHVTKKEIKFDLGNPGPDNLLETVFIGAIQNPTLFQGVTKIVQ